MVIIVLFLFLLNFRTTFITLTAIPMSLVMTTLVFRFVSWFSDTELSINVMTLGGIAGEQRRPGDALDVVITCRLAQRLYVVLQKLPIPH